MFVCLFVSISHTQISTCTGLSITCCVATTILIIFYVLSLAWTKALTRTAAFYRATDGLDNRPAYEHEHNHVQFSPEEEQHTVVAILLYCLAMIELVVSLSLAINCYTFQWRWHPDCPPVSTTVHLETN